MFKVSPFRHVNIKRKKDETYHMKLISEPAETSIGMTASAKWVALPYGTAGSLSIVPTDFEDFKRTDNPPLVNAHSSALGDLQFSPFADDVLATGASDSVKIWTIPTKGLQESLSTPTTQVTGLGGAIESLRWHPTAEGVLAVGAKEQVSIIDVATGTIKYSTPAKDVLGVAWNADGSTLAFLTKDCTIYLWDPRSGTEPTSKSLKDKARKVQHVLWVGKNQDKLLVAFSNNSHKPGFAVYDTASWECVKTLMLDASTGFTLPMYDNDSNLLFCTIRGAGNIQIIEVSEKKNSIELTPIQEARFDDTAKAFTLTSKRGLNILDCEVQRLYVLNKNEISVYSATVPKKGKGFYEDIHPPTAAATPAQSAEDYYAGGNKTAVMISPEIAYSQRMKAKDAALGGALSAEKEMAKEAIVNKLKEKEEAMAKMLHPEQPKIQEVTYQTSVTRKIIDSKFKGSIYKHLTCKEPNQKDQYWYDVQADKHVPLNRNICCNRKFFAFPWKCAGGSGVCVTPIDKPCRFPATDQLGLLRGHKEQVLCFDLNPTDLTQFASASVEGAAFIYRLPENGPTGSEQPVKKLTMAGKAMFCQWSPYVSNLLITSSSDFDNGYIRFWDTTGDEKMKDTPVLELVMPTNEHVLDIAFEPTGEFMALTTTDNGLRLWNLKQKKQIASVQHGLTTGRSASVFFCPGTGTLITVGLRGGARGIEVYAAADLKKLKEFTVDNNTGIPLSYYDMDSNVLMIGTTGGTSIRTYEILKEEPYANSLDAWAAPNQMRGLCFLPKSACDVKGVEVLKGFRLARDSVYPTSWTVPRKRVEFFQDDLFQDTMKLPVQTVQEFLSPAAAKPLYFSMKPQDMVALSEAPEEELTDRQKRYRESLIKKMDKPKATNVDGLSSKEQVEDHFRELAQKGYGGKSRFDAAQDDVNEVDDDEWGEDD
eukprot:gb/GEZN01001173.1/.p1 GENE.gb/GEZN01001173.1/~~gb/GEZN01001173.1/.p1  ORF type:complete len:932 (-),score=135.00 gb/GEZN01001173.1/:367-3162(-)